ncbi:MAG: NAD(P)H-binding protein [Bacteroidota bacterium]
MKIMILGATGLVGTECLRQAIADDRILRITVLTRSPLSVHHHKITECIAPLEEMEKYPALFSADAVLCALGTTIKKAGSQEAFRKVDLEFPLRAATLAHAQGTKHFLLVSALGAQTRSSVFYNRVKGEAEEAIMKIPFNRVTIVRPSLLLGDRKEFRPGEHFAQLFSRFIPAPYTPVHAHTVAARLISSLFDSKEGVTIIESKQI